MSEFTAVNAPVAAVTVDNVTEEQKSEAIAAAVAETEKKHTPKALTKLEMELEENTAEGKLIDAVYSPYNELVDMINAFKSFGDLDSLAKAEIENAEDHSEIGILRDKLSAMRAKVTEVEKLLNETSRAAAAEKLDPDFDELKARTAIKETRAHAAEMFKVAFATFEVLGHVETVKEFGKAPEITALTDAGEALIAATNIPNLKGTKGNATATTGDSKTTVIRDWAKAEGMEINDRGRISADIVAAYEKAHSA